MTVPSAHLEHLHAGTGLIDRSARGFVRLTGADRISFLQGILTNDVAALAPGGGCYAAYLTPQGRMITDLRVLVRPDDVILDVPPPARASLAGRLDRIVFTEDVGVEALPSWSSLSVMGAAAASAVGSALSIDADEVGALAAGPECAHGEVSWQGGALMLVASRELVPPDAPPGLAGGIDVCGEGQAVAALAEALVRSGAGWIPVGLAEALRIEARRPAFGVDMDEQTIPLEAGIEDRAISMTKGCYVGQEVIVRVLHRGHGRVARKLVAFEVEGGAPGEPLVGAGDPIRAGDREAGRVTSAAWSLLSGRTVGLGYVLREVAETAATLAIAHGDAEVSARIRR